MKCVGWINAATTDCKDVAAAVSESCSEWTKEGTKKCHDAMQKVADTCVEEVDKSKKKCVDWADETKKECNQWADEGSEECDTWADEGWEECGEWADEGYDECGEWADNGYSECSEWQDWGHSVCCDWKPCSWFCDALVWIANWVCVASVWIANWVCNFWYWVSSWVCKFAYWVANLVCQAWYWVANVVCTGWTILVKSTCIAWAFGTKWTCKGGTWLADMACFIFFGTINGACQTFAWSLGAACTIASWFARAVCFIFTFFACMVAGVTARLVRRVSRRPIQHVFVLMLENRSFDHMLGFANLTGTDPNGGGVILNGTSTLAGNFMKDGTTLINASADAPFKLAEKKEGPPHEFHHVTQQLCGLGNHYDPSKPYPPITMSGFVAMHEADGAPTVANVMRCFNPATLPVLHQLAAEYAVCDNWFSSVPGPTWPNRFFTHAATSGGLDHSPGGFDVFSHTGFNGYRFSNGTIFDRLEENCIDWEIFEGDETPQSWAMAGMNVYWWMGRFTELDSFEARINSDDPPVYGFIEPDYGHVLPLGPSPDDYSCGNSQHPVDDVTRGERLIKQVYETLRSSKIWNESVLIITYDEHGGFFDHVVPPSGVPPGDDQDPGYVQNHFDFAQLGVRVPAVIVSPLIPRGTIDHTQYDHTSILATIERNFGLDPLTERDKAAKDLLHLFTLASPRTDMPQISHPPASGFECEGDSPQLGTISSPAAVGPPQDATPPRERDIDPSTWGFLEVAARKEYKTAPYRARREMRRRFEAIRTEREMYEEMSASKQRLRNERIARKRQSRLSSR